MEIYKNVNDIVQIMEAKEEGIPCKKEQTMHQIQARTIE
jgi:hypothetical protein